MRPLMWGDLATVRKCVIFSEKPHKHLQGKDKFGVYWTLRAQPYPQSLCSCLASVFEDAAQLHTLAKLARACIWSPERGNANVCGLGTKIRVNVG